MYTRIPSQGLYVKILLWDHTWVVNCIVFSAKYWPTSTSCRLCPVKSYIQTCIKRQPLGQRKCGLLKEVQFIWNFYDRQEKSDLLIWWLNRVSAWAGSLQFSVFRLLTDFVCLYNYEFWLSLCKIVRSSVMLLLPLLTTWFLNFICDFQDVKWPTNL